jgi:hypothetical protein
VWRRFLQKLDPDERSTDLLGAPLLWPDGRHVAANGCGRIVLWELATGTCAQVLETGAIGEQSFLPACEPVLGRVLEGHKLRDVAIWDSTDWRCIQTFAGHVVECVDG